MAIFDPRLAPRVKPPSGLRPVELGTFGGLNLRDDPQQIGWSGAIDLLNVDFDASGRVRQRGGYTTFATPSNIGAIYDMAMYFSFSAGWFLVYAGSKGFGNHAVGVLDSSGSSVATLNVSGGVRWSFANLGTPSATYLYMANGSAVHRFDGTTLTTPAAFTGYTPAAVAVQRTDNRLVVVDGTDRVRFSNPGAPETFGANNYVDLTPGDGEEITALVPFSDYLVAFKKSKFFVFYGNSTDSSGNPVFNYRTVDGVGLGKSASSGAAVSGPNGIDFLSDRGIYRTTGGPAKKISDPVDGFFTEESLPYWTGTQFGSSSTVCPVWHDDRLLVTFGNAGILVYRQDIDAWSYWTTPSGLNGLLSVPNNDGTWGDGLFGCFGTTIVKFASSTATDGGTAIDSRYRTGFSDLGAGMSEKIVHGWQLDGTGNVGVKVAVNDGSLGSVATATLGTSPATANGFRPGRGWRGRNFSVQLEDVAGGAWTVNRVVAHVRGERPAGEKSPG